VDQDAGPRIRSLVAWDKWRWDGMSTRQREWRNVTCPLDTGVRLRAAS
jgi:hypothetical protein